jgi:hypothetical protein
VKNVTPPAVGPRPVTTPTPTARRNQIIALAAFVIVLVLIVRACAGGENKYEKIAHQLTQAVQNNDYNAVAKLENSQTAVEMGRGRLGHAADVLAPMGKIHRVKENTPSSDGPRVHEFDLTMDKGTVHEKIQFDPEDKIFHFNYDVVKPTK